MRWTFQIWFKYLFRLINQVCLYYSCFQNNVEIHIAHIQSGLSQMGNLHAFAANNTNTIWVLICRVKSFSKREKKKKKTLSVLCHV